MTKASRNDTDTVKTTFAAHGNPWSQLIKPQEPTMQPKTKPAPAPAPKPALNPKMSAARNAERIDVDALKIGDMAYPGRPYGAKNKYEAKLRDMPVNQRLIVATGDAEAVAQAFSQIVKRVRPGHIIRSIRDCGDGMGGVWLLKDEK